MRRALAKAAASSTDTTVANDNTYILLAGSANAFADGVHLYAYGGTVAEHSGNTLEINGEKGIKLANVVGYDNYNFYLPQGTQGGDTILHLTSTTEDTDLSNSKIYITANGALSVIKGDTINLIEKDGGQLITTGATVSGGANTTDTSSTGTSSTPVQTVSTLSTNAASTTVADTTSTDAVTEVTGQIGVSAGIKGYVHLRGSERRRLQRRHREEKREPSRRLHLGTVL